MCLPLRYKHRGLVSFGRPAHCKLLLWPCCWRMRLRTCGRMLRGSTTAVAAIAAAVAAAAAVIPAAAAADAVTAAVAAAAAAVAAVAASRHLHEQGIPEGGGPGLHRKRG